MSDTVAWIAACGAGVALGAVFYGGLWWTVRRGLSSPRPALWFAGSLLLRAAIALAGLALVSGGRWDRLLACLVGFVMARLAVTWLTRLPAAEAAAEAGEAGHAP